MVQNGGLGRAGGPGVVMGGDAVQKLGARRSREALGAVLDQPQAQMDVPEQAALLRRRERRAA